MGKLKSILRAFFTTWISVEEEPALPDPPSEIEPHSFEKMADAFLEALESLDKELD